MDLIDRAGDLKRELVEYGQSPRLRRYLDAWLDDLFDGAMDEQRFIAVMDAFLMEHRLPDGDTVIDRFLHARRDLDDTDRAILTAWKDPVHGLFEVRTRDGDALDTFNLVDELPYRMRSTMGSDPIAHIDAGMFLLGTVVAVGDEWMMSGAHQPFPAAARPEMRQTAMRLAMEFPRQVFRNPDKLARGWELQTGQRDSFIELFGADTIVVPGGKAHEKVREFYRFDFDRRGHDPKNWREPGFDLDAITGECDTVGIIFDPDDGLGYYLDFGAAQRAFATPKLVLQAFYRELISGYLRDENTSPVPIRRLAEQDTAKASRLFQKLLKKPSFDWERDGEALLRWYKPGHFAGPPLPRSVPMDLTAEEAAPVTGPAAVRPLRR